MKSTFKVEGMSCGHCVNRVSQALQQIPGVTVIDLSLSTGLAQLEADNIPGLEQLRETLLSVGAYDISKVEEVKP